jgi:predicted transcriptional regulator of viral defense system
MVEPRHLADWLLSHGKSWVTTEEAAELLGIPAEHVSPTLARWRRAGLLFSPTRGAYVPIPPEYRTWGTVPAANFVDHMMRHLGHPYYVGLLSAAELHGFAHQRPQAFQIVTPARLRDRTFGRVRLSFVTVSDISTRPTVTRNTPTGTLRLSTPEATLLDLVSMPRRGGGLDNVATITGEMLEEAALDVHALTEIADRYPAAVVQRTGYLIEHVAEIVGVAVDLDAFRAAALRRTSRVRQRPSGPTGKLDERWNVMVNADIEPDL